MSADLAQQLAAIQDMGVEGLRSVWRERLGEPPPIRSRDILRQPAAKAVIGRRIELARHDHVDEHPRREHARERARRGRDAAAEDR